MEFLGKNKVFNEIAIDSFGNLYAEFLLNGKRSLQVYDGKNWKEFTDLMGFTQIDQICFDSSGNMAVVGKRKINQTNETFIAKYLKE
jgi:hypothetical protein